MKVATVLFFVIWFATIGSWLGNTYQLTQCDFKAPFNCEAVHAVGLIPLASLVTVWFKTDGV